MDEPAGGEAPQEAVMIRKKVAFIHRRSRVFFVFNKGVLRVPDCNVAVLLLFITVYWESIVRNSAKKVRNSAKR